MQAEINQLKLSEKILLVEGIWDSIAITNAELPMPEWQKQELAEQISDQQLSDAIERNFWLPEYRDYQRASN